MPEATFAEAAERWLDNWMRVNGRATTDDDLKRLEAYLQKQIKNRGLVRLNKDATLVIPENTRLLSPLASYGPYDAIPAIEVRRDHRSRDFRFIIDVSCNPVVPGAVENGETWKADLPSALGCVVGVKDWSPLRTPLDGAAVAAAWHAATVKHTLLCLPTLPAGEIWINPAHVINIRPALGTEGHAD